MELYNIPGHVFHVGFYFVREQYKNSIQIEKPIFQFPKRNYTRQTPSFWNSFKTRRDGRDERGRHKHKGRVNVIEPDTMAGPRRQTNEPEAEATGRGGRAGTAGRCLDKAQKLHIPLTSCRARIRRNDDPRRPRHSPTSHCTAPRRNIAKAKRVAGKTNDQQFYYVKSSCSEFLMTFQSQFSRKA